MYDFFIWFRDRFADIGDMLGTISFDFGGFSVSLFDVLLGFVAMGIIISVFWKGART